MAAPFETPDLDQPLTKPQVQTAAYFLKIHDQGPSYSLFFRMNLPWLLLRCLPMALVFYLTITYKELRPASPAIGGLIIYSIYLEFLYPRVIGRIWPVYERLIDWDKARKLAEGR